MTLQEQSWFKACKCWQLQEKQETSLHLIPLTLSLDDIRQDNLQHLKIQPTFAQRKTI